MPAFGALTGGMPASDPAIEACAGYPASAIIGLTTKAVSFDLPFAPQKADSESSLQLHLPDIC